MRLWIAARLAVAAHPACGLALGALLMLQSAAFGEPADTHAAGVGAAAAMPIDTVTYNGSGVLLVNDTPYFPLGTFAHTGARSLIDNIDQAAQGGLNTVVASRWEPAANDLIPKKTYRRALAHAAEMGVAIIHNTDARNPDPADKVATARNYRDEPATFGYSISDDAHEHYTVDELARIDRKVGAVDADHVTMMADWGWDNGSQNYYGIADLSAAYWYPIHAEPTAYLINVTKTLDAAKNAAPSHPLVPLIQAFAWPDGRQPSALEIRNMSYMAIVCGANGLLFYELDGPDTDMLAHPEVWNAVKAVAAEAGSLSDVWTQGLRTRRPLSNEIQGSSWELNGRTTIVLVNPNYTPARSRLPDELQGKTYIRVGSSGGTLSGAGNALVANVDSAGALILHSE